MNDVIYEFGSELLSPINLQDGKCQLLFLFHTGDNLAAHQANGLFEAFSANFSCLYCLVPKINYNVTYSEKFDMLRTAIGTERQLGLINSATSKVEREQL